MMISQIYSIMIKSRKKLDEHMNLTDHPVKIRKNKWQVYKAANRFSSLTSLIAASFFSHLPFKVALSILALLSQLTLGD
jgi:hypothetical protein